MDNNLFIVIAIAIIAQSLILYVVIATAVQTKKRLLMDWARMKLLEKIALKQGVSAEEIKSIIEQV